MQKDLQGKVNNENVEELLDSTVKSSKPPSDSFTDLGKDSVYLPNCAVTRQPVAPCDLTELVDENSPSHDSYETKTEESLSPDELS